MSAQRVGKTFLALATSVVLLTTLLAVVAPSTAFATGTVLFQNSFTNKTVDGTGTVTVPTPSSGPNLACLTATGNTAALPVLSCTPAIDAQGAGALRFTSVTTNQVGGVYGATSFPTSNGLDVTFNSYQYGGGGADGVGFILAAVDPANPMPPTQMGPSGGSLGYTFANGAVGVSNAYMGVGLDVFGNFSNFTGSGCTNPATISSAVPGAVVVRGPGKGTVGYCGLTSTYDGTSGSKVVLKSTTRALSVVPVQVLINPTTTSFTSATGVVVAAGTYKVVVTPVQAGVLNPVSKTLTGPLPTVPSSLYPSTTWTTAAGIPKQLAFGFAGSTGSVTDVHEVSNVKVLTFNPVPQLAVVTTSYSASTVAAGGPVNYIVAASVLAGTDEANPISVTQTVPTGMVPVGAFGTGWTCLVPVGKTITCTTTASAFTNGTALPSVTVVAIVTAAAGLTSATIQNASSTTVSSTDGNPGSAAVMTAGTVPSVPTGVAVNPAIGPIAGGGVVVGSATTSTPPTAVFIGTAAEIQAGTPVVLLPCTAGRAVGCFNIEGSSLGILSMPARASSATVNFTVVTLGIAGVAAYVYADKPATAAAPTATAGITSAVVSWVAPAINGSALTSYILTPFLGGVAQTPITYDTGTTSRTLTGLTAGSSYTFTIAAVNAYGTSTASPQSVAVIPYNLPAAPTISAVAARDSGVALTWTTPANNGSAITGYVVTPYIGSTAQASQTFTGTASTQTAVGLTPGTAYTFTVAAINLAGTGPASARSTAGTPNSSPSLAFPAPPAGEVGAAYSNQLTVTNGTAPFVWSVSGGTLPAGLTLNASTGLLSGTPTAAGTVPFTVQIVDLSNQTATKTVSLVIAAAPSITFTPAAGEVSIAYSQQPTLTGGTPTIVWALSAGSLPAGVTLNTATGLLSGTPTASGGFTMTLTATDSFSQVAASTVTVVIAALPVLTFATPASGQVGVAYSTTFSVTGGSAPQVWTIPAGSLPPGLTLDSTTGILTGIPTTVGTSAFTVLVTDAFGKTSSKAVSLFIGAGPLVIVKTANGTTAAPGSTVSYSITVTNTGPTTWTGAAFSDPLTGVLDDAVYNANATASAGTLTYTAPNLGWTGNIAAAGVVTITYTVTVSNPDVGNKVLANTVTSATLGTNCAVGSIDSRCTATVTVSGLTIVKTADVATATPGSTVHFSILVTNSGQTAYAGATLTDGLVGVLDDAAYNADGTATAGGVVFSSPALTWTGNLAVGASATITYSVTVADPDAGNRSLASTIVSSTPGSSCPSGNPAAGCSATVTVLVPALSIATTTNAGSSTIPGATVVYTMTLSNTGQTAYTGTSVTLALAGVLDDAVYNGSSATAGAVVFDSTALTLAWTGNIAVGATVTVTGSVTVRNPDAGDKSLGTVATSPAAGSSCPVGGSSSSCATTVQVLIPALTITKAADVSSTTPGSVVRYSVTVTNTGQTPYTGAAFADSLTGIIDDATYQNNVTATSGTASFAGSTVSWTGNLLVGATATVSYSVLVNNPDTGNKSLTGTVTSATPFNNCLAGGTDPRCTGTVPVLIPGLGFAITSTAATTVPGGVVQYSLLVTNTGQTSYNGAAVTLNLDGLNDDATYNYDATTTTGSLVTNIDGTVNWVLNLAVGASATGTLSFTVNNPDGGNQSLLFIAVSDAPGSACPTGSAAGACRSTIAVLTPKLIITKTASAATVTPGGTVTYTVLVTNPGQTAYAPASFSDSLATVLTDATYADGATASSGTVSYDAATSTVSWSGALAVGASATIAYSVTVRDPDPGDKRMYNTVVSTAAGNNCAAGSVDPLCTAVVTVLVPALTIVKTANAVTTKPGDTIGYTVTVTNSGATAYTGAGFTDPLTDVLDDATYNNNAVATGGSASYAAPTLTWTGNLALGASATITYSVTVHSADGGNNLLKNTVTSNTPGNNCPGAGTDSRCSVTVPVARLVMLYTTGSPTTTPGSVVHLTGTFTNTGQVPYTAITINIVGGEDIVDDAASNGDQTASSGILTAGTTSAQWTGSIPVGGVVTLVGSVTVFNPDPGNKTLSISFVSTAPGNNCPALSADVRCKATVSVLVPGLSVVKSANTSAVVPGGVVGYTVTVTNSGQTAYGSASVSDSLVGVLDDASLDGGLSAPSASSGVVSFNAVSSVLSWSGGLAVGAVAVITYSVTVFSPDTGDKTMVNQVVSTDVGSTCPVASGNAACRTTVAVLTPSLTVVKTANASTVTLGTTVTYTVSVTNSGQTPYAAAAFTDALSGVTDDATFNAGSITASRGSAGFAGGVLSWSGALTPTQVATVTYSVTVNSPSSGDRSMSNTVVSASAGSNCGSGSTDPRCVSVVSVTNSVALVFNKSADVVSTVAGGVVHFTVSVSNTSGAAVPAVFTDSLAGVVDDASYGGDAAATAGTVTYAAPVLSWAGSVPSGGSVSVTYSATVFSVLTGNDLLTNTVVSTSLPGSNTCGSGSADPRCTVTVPVAALLITQAYTEPTTTPGSVIHLTGTFTNTGQLPYNGITISSPSADTVDDAIPAGDQSATSGTLVLSATAITWTGSIPVGGVVTITGTLTVKNPVTTGNKLITGTLVSTAPGNNCPPAGTDPRCTALSTVLIPALTISKTADATSVVPNGTVQYTVTVTNSGQTPYVGAIVTDSLVGILDDANYNANAVATTGAMSYSAPTLSWTGDLAVSASTVITYSVTAHRPATGDKIMLNTVTSTEVGSSCPPASGNTACRSTVPVLTPALTIISTVNAATSNPGNTISYLITITNSGQTAYNTARVTAPLGGIADDATYNGNAVASSGTVVLSGTDLLWTSPFAIGASATITYSVTVGNPDVGDHLVNQTVTSSNQGSTCPVGGTDPRCSTSVAVAGLHILSAVDVSTTKPTGVVRYTGTFTNTGQVPYVGISILIDITGAADDVTYNGDASATAGTLDIVPGAPEVSWSGDLAIGASVVVSSSVTVNDPDLGDKVLTTRISTTAPASNCPPGSTDPACVNSVQVLIPALTIVQSANTSFTTPGSTVGYTITATNTGETAYTAATVSDSLARLLNDATYNLNATATAGSVVFDGSQTLNWTGNLAVGAAVTISFTVTVNNPDLGDKVMISTAISNELGSTCPTGSSNTACTSFVLVQVPALRITLTADTVTTVPGAAVGYSMTVHNTGQTAYPGAVVTVALVGVLDDAAYSGGSATVGGVTFSPTPAGSPTLTWTGDLAVGATAIITYGVAVADPDVGDRTLTTSVSSLAPGSTCSATAPCVNTVTVLIPGLAVSTGANAATATPGDHVGFTITVTNTGETPYVGTVVSTSLAGILDDASLDGTVRSSSGVATYVAPDISWTGSLAVGATATISYTVTINNPDTGTRTLVTTVVAPAQGSTCHSGSVNPQCTATVTVLVPALTISKSAGSSTTTPGSVVSYTVIVTNSGQTAYLGASVVDDLSGVLGDADYNGDAAAVGGGVFLYTSPNLTWTGNLPIGASATISYSITVHNPDTGDKQISNSVSSTVPGSSCLPGSSVPTCTAVVNVLVPGLVVTKTANAATVVAGSAVQYTITVSNTGQTAYAPATFTDPLTSVLDDASYAGGAVASTGSLDYTNNTLAWSGALGIGTTATITYSVTTLFPATGNQTLANTVVSAMPGSNCVTAADPRCSSTVTVLVPALTVTKSVDTNAVVAGGTVHYTISATNTGQANYPAASLTDSLAGILDDAVYNGDATATTGTISYAASTIDWTGVLPIGATVLITYSIGVNVTDTGDAVLTNRVVSTSVGTSCTVGGSNPACATSTTVDVRTISLTGLTPSFTLTGPPSSTVTADGATVMTVTTNSVGGYFVTVQAGSNTLDGTGGNTETIPIQLLKVRESGTTPFQPMSSQSPLVIYRESTPSAPGGDAVSNDYQMQIPFVAPDTYSATLDYIATAQ